MGLRKYFYIYKATLLEKLQYIMNTLLGFISFFVMLFIFFNLWNYIYADATQLISGYTKTQMIWYVIITETLWFGTTNRTLTNQVSQDIKSGSIAYGLNKPYNYIYFIIAKHFGEITFQFFLFLIAGTVIGVGFLGGLPGFNLMYLPFYIPVFFLGILINSLIRLLISIFSFWMEDSGSLHWIYNKLIIVVGTLFPVEIFPLWLQPVIRFSPIFVVTYGPAKLVIDFSIEQLFKVLAAQTAYVIGLVCLLAYFYQRGVKKVNVNGG